MDRKNIWILGGAIVLGFLVFGLSQSWAQRFPGDGRGGADNMVGRYQVVRSSPDVILLLDTVTGELYSASQDDIRPSRARPRAGETREPDFRFKDKGDFKERIPSPAFQDKAKASDKADFRRGFKEKVDFRRDDFKDRHDFKDKGDFRREEFKDKADFRREEFKDKGDFRKDGFKDKGDFRQEQPKDKGGDGFKYDKKG
jgi:hypothetical protein